ncbi:MAG: LysR family transcriptional regulator [Pseudomonadota bacterium]
MQHSLGVSLNALRVFVIAAERRSLKSAGAILGVTPSAVSHQVRGLEDTLGTALFVRGHNSIELTEAGARLLSRAAPGLTSLEDAISDVVRDTREISVRVSTTLAVRWLIPKLDAFRSRHPNALVQIETVGAIGMPPGPKADVNIGYYRATDALDGAEILIRDVCSPYLSPNLLARLGDQPKIEEIPALQCANENWDWRLWLEESGRAGVELTYTDRFDLDDAALRAAVAGMGMILTSKHIVRDEIDAGRLSPLPDAPAIELGCYAVQNGGRETGLSQAFLNWLKSVADTG